MSFYDTFCAFLEEMTVRYKVLSNSIDDLSD
jgi:hypothetical protein